MNPRLQKALEKRKQRQINAQIRHVAEEIDKRNAELQRSEMLRRTQQNFLYGK